MTDTRHVLLKCRNSVLPVIRYDAVAGHVVLVECHHTVLPIIWAVLLYVVELWVFVVEINNFLTSRYLWYCYCYGLAGTAPNRSIHARIKSAANTFINACGFFLSHLRVFLAHYFVKLPPFDTSYRGSHDTHSSPFPTTERVPSF